MTSGSAKIGIEFLGAKFVSNLSKTDIVLTGSFALLRSARTDLNALGDSQKSCWPSVASWALGTTSMSALMLTTYVTS